MQRVRFDNGAIIIDMVQPGTVYIPQYDPIRVYGAWSYPDYPPYYFHRPVAVRNYFVVASLWGWSSWEWNRHRIRVDLPRYRYFSRQHPWRHNDDTWRHDRGRGSAITYRRDDRRGDWRDNNRRGNDWNRNDWNRNDRRDGRSDGRPNGQWDGRRDGDRDGRRDADGNGRRDFRGDRRGEQRTDSTPNPATSPPVGAFRGDPTENRRRFEANRGGESRFRGRTPEPNAAPSPQAVEEENRRRMGGGRDRSQADRGPDEGRRQFRGRQDQQAYTGPQLTPPAPVAPIPQEPRVSREQRREFRAADAPRGNPDENRRQYRGTGGVDGSQPDANRGGNREFRRGGGGGNGNNGDGEDRGRGRRNGRD
jgi:hypothetical protein